MLDNDSIAAFLHFGFVPEYTAGQLASLCDWSKQGERKETFVRRSIRSLIAEGVQVLKAVFHEVIEKAGTGKMHVLPLSGGLDSRAILGGLLESVPIKQIQAVTFGTPGTWDYEIGRDVAKAVGVGHECIDITSSEWRWDIAGLIQAATKTERPIRVFDVYVNRQIPECCGRGPVYWSGFIGEALTGSHLPVYSSSSWAQTRSHFVSWNRLTRSINLSPAHFRPEDCLPGCPLCDHDALSYDDQLDFAIRQQCMIRHIVLPKGYDYRTPFLHSDWINFVLSVPRRYRQGQYLYKEILQAAYPLLFSLPTKNNHGLPLTAPRWQRSLRRQGLRMRGAAKRLIPWVNWAASPGINYIDFDHGLRERPDLKAVVYESIQDLKRRQIIDWIDIDGIWDRHQKRQGNHADALTLLSSLEINLKVQGTPQK